MLPALIDTHVHLYHRRLSDDRTAVISRAHEAGVTTMLLPAIDVPSIEQALNLAETHDGIYVMSAIHPSEVKDATEADLEKVADFCTHPKVVAVGESGLDYYWDRSFDEKQHAYLRWHIQLAMAQDLLLILHNREASADLVRILQEEKAAADHPEKLRGIFHCFTGPKWVAEAAQDLGFLLGLGGVLTFKNSGLAEVVATLDMAQLVLETDAPFLAPAPHRGKRNEPAYVRLVAEKLAEIKGLTVEEVAAQTSANARQLFGVS